MREASPRATAIAPGDYGEFEGALSDRVVFGSYRANGTWSPALVKLLAGVLRGGGTLLDIGANIGLVAIAVAQRSGARCLAFEPEPHNAALLARNVARHGLQDRIELHPVALDERAGAVTLALSADNSGDHRIAGARLAPDTPRCTVPAARLGDVLAGRTLARPAAMKLDTQGAEARVLRGAGDQVLSQIDVLVVEYWPAGLLRTGDSAALLFEQLARFPYAGLLDPRSPVPQLEPTPSFLPRLAWIPADGSDEGFFDLVLARTPEL
jgi:FkbM family methyltransferase